MSGGWGGSTRRDGLPSWWPVTQRRILKRDPVCRCPGCIKCTEMHRRCTRPSAEADHIGDRTDHRDIMLLGKCGPCHGKKSSQEGNAARRRPTRPTEKHPGDLT